MLVFELNVYHLSSEFGTQDFRLTFAVPLRVEAEGFVYSI